MVRRFLEGAYQFRQQLTAGGDHHKRVGGPEFRQRHAFQRAVVIADAPIDGENQRKFGVACAALRIEIEVTELDDLVAPEFEPYGFGHAERVDVEDAATHRELGHVFNHRYAFKADRFEVGREIFRAPFVPFAQFKAGASKCARQRGAFEHRARRRQQETNATAHQFFERFNAFARDFRVRLDFTKAFARRVQSNRKIVDHRFEVGKPPLRVR